MDSEVKSLADRLRDNVVLIAKLERSLAIHHSSSVAASLRSLYKLNRAYQEELLSSIDPERNNP